MALIGKLGIIPVAAVGILIGVLLAFFLVLRPLTSGGGGGGGEAAHLPPPLPVARPDLPGPTYAIAQRVYNLQDPQARRYLKLALSLEFAAVTPTGLPTDKYQKAAGEAYTALMTEFGKEIAPKKDFILDTLTAVISAKKLDEVIKPEGKEALKQEIIDKLNHDIGHEPNLKITKVYFTDFVIQ